MTLNEISAVIVLPFPDISILYEVTSDTLVGVPEIIPVQAEISIPGGKALDEGDMVNSIEALLESIKKEGLYV